jgi:hypothetical protein
MKEQERRQTADGRRLTDARINARSSFVGGRRSKKEKHSPPRHKDTKGRLTGRTGRKGRRVRRKELGVRRIAAILPSSLIYHPSSAVFTGRTGRKGRRVRREASGVRRAAAILPSSLIYHPSSAVFTGRTGRKGRRVRRKELGVRR